MLRFSKGKAEADIPAIDRVGGCDVLLRSGESDVLLVAVGSMVPTCLEVATRLEGQGIGATVVDPRWIKPVDAELVELARKYRLVVSVEDNGRTGGAGAALGVALCDEGVDTPLHVVGIPQEFLSHAKRPALIARLGLGAQDLARDIVERIALLDDELLDPAPDLETAPLQTDPHP
jgi:1-deoxy-D-xylulose-5-phosphate synthase